MMNISALVFGLIIVIMGFFARHPRYLNLISWHDPDRVKDKEGLAKWIGTTIIVIGLSLMAFGTWETAAQNRILIGGLLLIIILCSAAGAKKFMK